MPRTIYAGIILLAGCLAVSSVNNAGAQRRSYGGRQRVYVQQSSRRIEALEQRVAAIERQLGRRVNNVLPEQTEITVEKAQQQLEAAQERFDFSKELFRKGYISEAELERDQFAVKRMSKVLRLASTTPGTEPFQGISREIDIADAEHNLAVAERQLRLAKQIVARGFLGATGVEAHGRAVEDARKKLDELKKEGA